MIPVPGSADTRADLAWMSLLGTKASVVMESKLGCNGIEHHAELCRSGAMAMTNLMTVEHERCVIGQRRSRYKPGASERSPLALVPPKLVGEANQIAGNRRPDRLAVVLDFEDASDEVSRQRFVAACRTREHNVDSMDARAIPHNVHGLAEATWWTRTIPHMAKASQAVLK